MMLGLNFTSLAQPFQLQILHASDFEAGLSVPKPAPNFAAIVDALDNTYPNTVILSSGDNFIPSPFSFSGGDPALNSSLQSTYASYFGTSTVYSLAASIARVDISILNFLGIEASVLGNHDFDFGTTELRNIINTAGSN